MLKLPIGYSDFGNIVRQKLDFVDKTLLISERQYDTVLIQKGISRILKIGLAFRGKQVAVAYSPIEQTVQ